jgi:DNA replication protein DnaC
MNADLNEIRSGLAMWRDVAQQDHRRWYEQMLRETNWVEVARDAKLDDVKWTRDLMWAVAKGQNCPACADTKHIRVVRYGTATGMYMDDYPDCECVKYRSLWKVFCDYIPEHYLGVSLSDLSPSTSSKLPIARQESEIAFIRERKDDGFFFLGPAGTSKTTFAIALYRDALTTLFRQQWKGSSLTLYAGPQGIWRINGDSLLRQFHEKATNFEAKEPDVTAGKIRSEARSKRRPCLILEEIDKSKMTDFRANTLFALVDALYECGGRLVLTTNLTLTEFAGMFSNSGSDNIRATGAALMRRIKEMCHIRNYHEVNSKL